MVSFGLLGSGVNRPIEGRYLTSLIINANGNWFLFDSPENVQVQLQRYYGSMNLDGIFLTGLRPDTAFGLPGLLTTLDWLSSDNPELSEIDLYIPEVNGGRECIKKVTDLGNSNVTIHEVGRREEVLNTDEYTISTFPTNSGGKGPTIGYRCQEEEQKGRFDREKAEELGIPAGPKFSELHEGNPVELEDGRTIQPNQVVGSPRPGRSLAYTGATEYLEKIPEGVREVDILFIDGGSSTRRTEKKISGHMNAYEAGTVAGAADASVVVLTHVRRVYNESYSPLVEEITEAYDGPYLIGEDGIKGTIGSHDNNEDVSTLDDVLVELKGHRSVKDFPD